jgi:uncharacterized membrane protein
MTGYVMMFRKTDVLDLKLTIEEALEYIVSCGVVVAEHQWQSPENLARLRGETTPSAALPGRFTTSDPPPDSSPPAGGS